MSKAQNQQRRRGVGGVYPNLDHDLNGLDIPWWTPDSIAPRLGVVLRTRSDIWETRTFRAPLEPGGRFVLIDVPTARHRRRRGGSDQRFVDAECFSCHTRLARIEFNGGSYVQTSVPPWMFDARPDVSGLPLVAPRRLAPAKFPSTHGRGTQRTERKWRPIKGTFLAICGGCGRKQAIDPYWPHR